MKLLNFLFALLILFVINPSFAQDKGTYVQHGSGFAIASNGYVITNYHVIFVDQFKGKTINKPGDYFEVIQLLNGEVIRHKAKIVSADHLNDLVILKIVDSNFTSFPTIPYQIKFRTAEKGSDIFTLGYPRFDIEGLETKVTKGIVIAQTGYVGDVGHYTISAPIDHGSSGGPLFDNDGNVIGVTDQGVSIESSKYSSQSLSTSQFYAIKSTKISPMLDVLSDVEFPKTNTISNLEFTKKIKILEKYVFLIATYIYEQNTNSLSVSKGKSSKQVPSANSTGDINIGTTVYFRRQHQNRVGTVTNIKSINGKDIYVITYLGPFKLPQTVELPLSRLATSPN